MVETQNETTKRKFPKALKIFVAVVVVCLALAALILLAALRKPVPFPFLKDARVVHTEEWIESDPTSGWGRLKTGGLYIVSGDVPEVVAKVRKTLSPPKWQESTGRASTHFDNGLQFVTLQKGPSEHEVKIAIQTYRSPSLLDRIRLWYTHRFLGKK